MPLAIYVPCHKFLKSSRKAVNTAVRPKRVLVPSFALLVTLALAVDSVLHLLITFTLSRIPKLVVLPAPLSIFLKEPGFLVIGIEALANVLVVFVCASIEAA
ncbi:hypothetical protein BV25DRAFT_1833556 [Artomyces pyxidatus]|uniref:Uncharacterized protein n=1 Tax=Artomyces pyxidatus TaxID=48021 RepID=A0ACB8SDU8_9AGAM|nr:hypothetical protein BV25DRAFT_1833556 [Artomyces pyxidatus]